ncbi:MAG: translation elongation factor Ts [Planctomycetota bacterium]|nr:MAG: translation elongation factor Ts [Planctomycetota bacterium]
MTISSSQIKELREKTGIGILDCKKALVEAKGNMEKAIEILRKKGLKTVEKKSSRTASEGRIESYIHSNGKIGVLLELRCETDFVAKNEEFKELSHNLCMQVAATNPLALAPEDLPAEVIEKEKEVYREQMKDKPPQKLNAIIEGKLRKFYQEKCLLKQIYIKDPKGKQTIEQLLQNIVAKMGENIYIKRFVRFEVGEEDTPQTAPNTSSKQENASNQENVSNTTTKKSSKTKSTKKSSKTKTKKKKK